MMKACLLFLLGFYCLPLGLYAQSGDSDELLELTDLLYVDELQVANDTLQRLNLVVPVGKKKMPLFVWIGGGAWAYVNRHGEMDLARKFAQEGMAVASLGHRLSPAIWRDSTMIEGVQHPAHIEDVAIAFKWLYDHADAYGYDRDQMFIGGYSSGGHLAALLSVAEKHLAHVGLPREVIKGVIPIAGAYDISAYHRVFLDSSRPELADLHVKAVFGDTEEDFKDASPTSYVASMTIPMLLISESQSYNYTRIFENSIVASDFNDLEVIHVREMGHGEFWNHLASADSSTYRDSIVQFIKSGNG
ncbi:MAG: alpha/beta hydrolase [Rhodothermales bacterium]